MLINRAEIEWGLIGVGQDQSASKSVETFTFEWKCRPSGRHLYLDLNMSMRLLWLWLGQMHLTHHIYFYPAFFTNYCCTLVNNLYPSIAVVLSPRLWCVFLRRETPAPRSQWRCWTVTQWLRWKISCWMRCIKGSHTLRDHKLMTWTSVRAHHISNSSFIHTDMQYLKSLAVVSIINSL